MLLFIRPVLYLAGVIQLIVAGLMMVPALLEIFSGGTEAQAFATSALITGTAAALLMTAMRGEYRNLKLQQMFLLVVVSWLFTSLTCALPFVIASIDLSYTDAVFEAVSGITTTGGTVISGLDHLNAGILLWRALTQWLGGIGIVGMAIILFPFLRIGGLQLFKSESSEKGEKIFAQAKIFAASLLSVYLAISAISLILFHLAGMNWFDALCHMMTAVSTGGFSTKDMSLGYFNSLPVLWAASASMLLGALPFTWYMLVSVDWQRAWRDEQVRDYLQVTLIFIALMTAWVMAKTSYTSFEALTHSAVNVVSIMTTTGFASTDYLQWGSFAVMLFALLYFSGGCTGSTTGSIKIFRWSIIFISLRHQLLRMMSPHRISPLRYNGRPFSDEIKDSVANFIVLFFIIWLLFSVLLSLSGLEPAAASGAALSALSNVGPALTPEIGPVGNFAHLPDLAKWLLSCAMLLGRLELLVVILVCMPSYWRD